MDRHPDAGQPRPPFDRGSTAQSRLMLVGWILSARCADGGYDAVIADRRPPRPHGI